MPATAIPRGSSPTMAVPTGMNNVKQADFVQDVTRRLAGDEHWKLWHFENHAVSCNACRDPYVNYLAGKKLCQTGHELAHKVAATVYSNSDATIVYSKKDYSPSKQVRVQVPAGYDSTLGLLKAMQRGLRLHRQSPIISYDRTYMVQPRPVVESSSIKRSPSVSSKDSRTTRSSRSPTPSASLRRTNSQRDERRRSASQSKPRPKSIVDWPVEIRQPATPPLVYESDSTSTPPASPRFSEPVTRSSPKPRTAAAAAAVSHSSASTLNRPSSIRRTHPPSSYRGPTKLESDGSLPSFAALSIGDKAKVNVQTEQPRYNTAVREPSSSSSSSSSSKAVKPRRNSTFFL